MAGTVARLQGEENAECRVDTGGDVRQ